MTMLIPLHALLVTGRPAGHPVCHDGQRFVPWQEFASCVAAQSREFAARPEVRWLLTSDDPLEFAVQIFALLHAGKQVVIPPNTQSGTLIQLADAFDAVAEAVSRPSQPTDFLKPLDAHAAIIDIYTSGSTGEPKHVQKTLIQFETEVSTLEMIWGEKLGNSVIAATAPHHHFYGLLFRLFWSLSAGRAFDNVTCAHPDTLVERLALLKDCTLVSNPAQLSRLPELVPLSTLQPPPRMIFSSGGPLPASAAAEFYHQLGRAPTEVFGSTETGGIGWRRQEGEDTWTPMPGMALTAGQDGALLLRSPFLLLTEHDDPWQMDDAVELLPDGRFRLKGRLDRVVKIEEKRLSLPEMEARLVEHSWVTAAAVVALSGRRQYIGAVLVLTPEGRAYLASHGRRATTQLMRRHLSKHFDPVLRPRRWRFPDQLPINERGKLTQAALAALFVAEVSDDA